MPGLTQPATTAQRSMGSAKTQSRGLRVKGTRRCSWCRALGHQRKQCQLNPPPDPVLEKKNKKQRAEYAALTPEQKRARLDMNREYVFGLQPGAIAEFRKKQDGCCGICSARLVEGNGWNQEHVDHDHDTGRVRGLLCGRCNTTVGRIEALQKRGAVSKLLAWIGESR